MVNINSVNLNNPYGNFKPLQSVAGAKVGRENYQQPKDDLLQRLNNIDNGGDTSAVFAINGSSKIQPTSAIKSSSGYDSNLMAKLEAIGSGELSPKYSERNFDKIV